MTSESLVFKIVEKAEWSEARALGVYAGSQADRSDGFIHLSAADQVQSTASKWFAGRRGLLLIALDEEALGPGLRWEASRGGALFPHLYEGLPIAAVVWERELAIDDAGQFVLGSLTR